MTTPTISSFGGPLFFFREFEEPYDFLSQWYASTFTAPAPPSAGANAAPLTFLTTEQYMMYHKAIEFDDRAIADQILIETGPRKQKALGRKVKNFDHKKWDKVKEHIVEEGNWWKMTHSKDHDLRKMLLETGSRELVEASPFDKIWGIGYGAANAEAGRGSWGENLLGKALMRVRDRLQADHHLSEEKLEDNENENAS